jgi:pyruvate ferredoxin oxidoreductase alpha subunit
MAQGTAVLGGAVYSYFRYQQHLAQEHALAVYQEVAEEFAACFGRHYGVVEPFDLDDAEYVLVMSNAYATKGKAAVRRLRERGVKAGLLRLRVLRPLPTAAIAAVLEGRRAVAVIDQNLAPGLGGITYQEIAAALYATDHRPPLLSIIGGLGGKDISEAEFDAIFHDLQRAATGERVISPRLLYTQPELERMRTLLHIAGKEGGDERPPGATASAQGGFATFRPRSGGKEGGDERPLRPRSGGKEGGDERPLRPRSGGKEVSA